MLPVKQPRVDVCPGCNGIGWVVRPPVASDGSYDPSDGGGWYHNGVDLKTKMLPCRLCSTEKRQAWLEEHSGLEPSERILSLDQFRIAQLDESEWTTQRIQAKTAIREAIDEHIGLYTFWGDFGSGKTLAMQIIVNELRHKMIEGYYAPFAVIIDSLRQMWATKQDTSAYWERLLSVPVLALDEISRFDEDRAWIRDRLFVLADTRYRMKHSHLTIFGTNSNPNVALPTSDAVGYLFSRMREGQISELRGDLRAMARVRS